MNACQCGCGRPVTRRRNMFIHGHNSVGAKHPLLSANNRARTIHGMASSSTSKSWNAMIQRITNPRCQDYPEYAGRGIDMDPRWLNFVAFFADMGIKPKGTSLGRRDNNRGYWPDNCQWETPRQQANNRRGNRRVTIGQRTQTLTEWAREVGGITARALSYRIEANWPPEELLAKAYQGRRREPEEREE